MNIWLIGMMGSGKSTVGPHLAEALGVSFVDTDEVIETVSGLSIDELWKVQGEAFFRNLEENAVRDLATGDGNVVALGGGAVLSEAVRDVLASESIVIWLKASSEELVARIGSGDGRPLLADGDLSERLRAILKSRLPVYEEVATHAFETSGIQAEEVVDLILEGMQ